MRPDGFFVPGRAGRRAELAAQARPYGRFFGSGRHDAEDGPMGRDPARHYRRRHGGEGHGTGGAWRSAWSELRRPTAQAGAARTPAPAAYLDRGGRSSIPAATRGGRAAGDRRQRRVEAEAGGVCSRGGGGRRGGCSGAPRRRSARPDPRPCGSAAVRERTKGRRRDLQEAARQGQGRDLQARRGRGGGGICRGRGRGGGGLGGN
jgi:hypothetical protein